MQLTTASLVLAAPKTPSPSDFVSNPNLGIWGQLSGTWQLITGLLLGLVMVLAIVFGVIDLVKFVAARSNRDKRQLAMDGMKTAAIAFVIAFLFSAVFTVGWQFLVQIKKSISG